MEGSTQTARSRNRPLVWRSLALSASIYSTCLIILILLMHLPFASDYVGKDNDNVMRLVEVRDFLGGQDWFDLTQYRLGLEGGTLMHWSRLVDLPIAALVWFFALFLSPHGAEAVALTVWPLLLIVPLMAAMGLAGRRVGGTQAMHIALGFTALMVMLNSKFRPGAIDHHNVQIVTVAIILAMLVDPRQKPLSFAIAGLASAFAIAVGAETTPLVATVCVVVAVTWAWHGIRFASAARAFALALVAAESAFFFATIPPARYGVVTCDNLSLGYYGLLLVGGGLLFIAALFANGASRTGRFAVLAGLAVVSGVTAVLLAPHCLGNPLRDLDPLLVSLWLDQVQEAQSVFSELKTEPGIAGGFYATGLFALVVCVFRILRRDRVELHLTLLPLVLVSWLIALVQVRGSLFSNLIAIVPLSLLVSQLRSNANREPENLSASFAFVCATVFAVPTVWAFGGSLFFEGTGGLINRVENVMPAAARDADSCTSEGALQQLAALDPGVVAAASNNGAQILRFTRHRVLAAPYHRNQAGMLAELKIGLAKPEEAKKLLEQAKVNIVAFCASDPQTQRLMKLEPEGLYSSLKRGNVPPYLDPLPQPDEASGLRLYRVRTE